MQEELSIFWFLLGIGIGGSFFFTILRSKIQATEKQMQLEHEAKEKEWDIRLQTEIQKVKELESLLKKRSSEFTYLQEELSWEREKREELEKKSLQLPQLKALLEKKEQQLEELQKQNISLQKELVKLKIQLEEKEKIREEHSNFIQKFQEDFTTLFKALSAEALQQNNQAFLELAKNSLERFQDKAQTDLEMRQKGIEHLVGPLKDLLQQVEHKIQELQKGRNMTYGSISEQMKSLAETQSKLYKETAKLVRALRTPMVRGRWGEIQLQRVVEIAGMVEHCDFVQQESMSTENGTLRPDMVIKLPNDKSIIVDSKAPLQAYLEALEIEDEEEQKQKLKEHARQIRSHLVQLSQKSYWEQLSSAPEFVVLFLPAESFFSAALSQDPMLIEYGVKKKVILATPTTLIALLLVVAYGWKQERITQNTKLISELGKTLHERLRTLSGYFLELRKGLERAMENYNKAVASIETRILVTARKFEELGASNSYPIETLEPIEMQLRSFPKEELPLFPEEDSHFLKDSSEKELDGKN